MDLKISFKDSVRFADLAYITLKNLAIYCRYIGRIVGGGALSKGSQMRLEPSKRKTRSVTTLLTKKVIAIHLLDRNIHY